MKRRTLFKLTSFLIMGVSVPLVWQNHLLQPKQSSLQQYKLSNQLLRLFSHIPSAKAIGNEYLRSFNNPDQRKHFHSKIYANFEAELSVLTPLNRHQLRQWLTQRQQQDFEQGRTIQLRGWVLSQTEVELCALAVLESIS